MQLDKQIKELVSNDDKFTVAKIAQQLGVKQVDVLLNLPNEVATWTNGSDFDEIIKNIQNWGEVLIVKPTENFIFEIRSHIPAGSYARGYYNFEHDAPLSGHLKADEIDKIVFLSAKVVMGMLSHCVLFLDKNGDDIFKIYVSRDEKREFIAHQLEAFSKLKNSYNK